MFFSPPPYHAHVRISTPRFDPTIGDIAGNARLVLECAESAVAAGAHALLLPELAICGYPPRDLLLRGGFVEQCVRELDRLAQALPPDLLVLIGSPLRTPSGEVLNALVAIRDGKRLTSAAKRLMPDYDVFDEDRWFTPGRQACVVPHRGVRLGLLVCEDLWQGGDAGVQVPWPCDPVADVLAVGCDAILAASASPWVAGKHVRQVARVRQVAASGGVDVVAVNQAGANDDLVFDGAVIHASPTGDCCPGRLQFCARDHSLVVNLGADAVDLESPWPETPVRAMALREAIRGYVGKTGAPGVLVGLSGGIDSALTATLAVSALGAHRVEGVAMPSRYSSQQSLGDARDLCSALRMAPPRVIPIASVHASVRSALEASGAAIADGDVADQNIQARVRGQLLMALSNETGQLLLPTGNKSELAVGYATLYGDMCGALAVLGDVLKTQVYNMAAVLNEAPHLLGLDEPPIPVATIERPPTAELAPDQCDQDTLPDYEVLDAIISHIVDGDASVEETAAATGLDLHIVTRWAGVIDRNEFKRWQAAIIPKVSRRAFGRGRRWPIVARSV